MKRKAATIAAIGAVFVIVAATAASALVQTNGNGKTSEGNTLGFNAQADLSGNFEYQFVADLDGASYNVHCNDYTRYVATTTTNGTYPKSLVSATNCFDTDGVRYYVHAEFVDRGEPGTRDGACITVKVYPGRSNPVLQKDCGIIQDGNIQIHPTNAPASAEMLPTP